MIHVIAEIEVRPGKREEFLRRFEQLVPKVLQEPGCLEYGPAVDLPTALGNQAPVRDNVITVIEKWENLEALERHLIAPHMVQYREEVKDLVVHSQLRVLQPASPAQGEYSI